MARKSFPLRIDVEIHRALEEWAADELRSVNGHIEYLLRQSLTEAGRLPGKNRAPHGPAEENREDNQDDGI